jgi:uncharacterized protein
MLVGIISDTHGLVRPEALAALRGSTSIIHAGDIGKPSVLECLRAIAPVTAVRGNIDTQAWAASLPETAVVTANGHKIFVLHDLSQLAVDPRQAGLAVVVSGHSHKCGIEKRDGIVYVNPGSAGPRRFRLAVTLAHLYLSRGSLRPEIIPLPVI